MKGHSSNMRYRFGGTTLKTKSIHGVQTGNHSNPNVLKAGMLHRADGGVCHGESAPKNLARMGRLRGGAVKHKREDGGATPPPPPPPPEKPKPMSRGQYRTSKIMEALTGRKHGGKVARKHRDMGGGFSLAGLGQGLSQMSKLGTPGGGQDGQQKKDDDQNAAQKVGQGLMTSALGLRKHGGKVGIAAEEEKIGEEELKQHRMEHKALKDEEDDDSEDRAERKSGGRAGKWIQGAIKHPGALHKALHVPKGEKIPEAKLEKAAHSDNPKLAQRARFAETLKGLRK